MRAVSGLSLIPALPPARPSDEHEKCQTSFDDGSQTLDFDQFVETSCKIFECPILVQVLKMIQQPSKHAKKHGLKHKRKRSDEPHPEGSPNTKPNSHPSLRLVGFVPDHTRLSITAVYDHHHKLVEILMFKYAYAPIPRTLMKVIALKIPFTRHLTKFTIKQCRIDMYTIHDLNKILLISNITDICLDQCPLKEGNYDILLSDASSLQSLSLSRCNINDVVCERMASRLHHLEPAEPTLLVLNLSSNRITDVGTKYLAEALRNNRHLRYLNLSDNQISDYGAKYILDVLAEFPLNTDEIQDKNSCFKDYLLSKEELYRKYLIDLAIKIETSRRKSSLKRKLSAKKIKVKQEFEDEMMKIKARSMALETIGPFEHPFDSTMVTVKEGRSYCIGNFTLCYLNLRYNNLTYLSVQRLAKVVSHQKMYRNEKMCGLVNVLLEGNNVPKEVNEYILINKDLNKDHALSKGSIKETDKIKPTGHRNLSK
ncbi:hypothetical protein PYW07_009099 [Mythimna separata]|uniref:Uncharacterized protein n=1 Tax=Mythimna separata TaxID=271217 RepID=A0AAD7YBU0_MYTSE|nr:hypothetical protein PYW07_009099 [Mythimna separata]